MAEERSPRVWVTYAWADNEEGNFDYLAQELAGAGVEAAYDRVQLIPGLRLWDQIADRIMKDPLDGWAYLITPNSLASEPCREELAYALARALETKGPGFPLIGLVASGVPVGEIPAAIRTRLYVSLSNPNWREQVRAGLEQRPIAPNTQKVTRYVWTFHPAYVAGATAPPRPAVEVRPRFGQIEFWRFIVPASAKVANYGPGGSRGAGLTPVRFNEVDGTGVDVNGLPAKFVGGGNALSQTMSAYLVFDGDLPEFVGFTRALDPMGPPLPDDIEFIRLSAQVSPYGASEPLA